MANLTPKLRMYKTTGDKNHILKLTIHMLLNLILNIVIEYL